MAIGKGRGRGGPPQGLGQKEKRGEGAPPTKCVCSNPKCEYETSHPRGTPCLEMECPKCGSPMIGKI